VWYWGDIDVEGFGILARLRTLFPQTRSLLMDGETVERWRSLAVPGTGRRAEAPPNLTLEEQMAFGICLRENLRIEQERLPPAAVQAALQETVAS
jgi:hypothetical protein